MPKPSYHHGDLRASLLDAAYALVDRDGLEALTIRRVAREVGVSHAAPARHYEGLIALKAAVAARALMQQRLAMIAPEGTPPILQMRQVGAGYLTFAFTHPGAFRAAYHPSLVEHHHLEQLGQCFAATFDHVVATVERCQEAGVIRKGDSRDIAQYAWSTVHGAACLGLDGQVEIESPESYGMKITYNIFAGLRAES